MMRLFAGLSEQGACIYFFLNLFWSFY